MKKYVLYIGRWQPFHNGHKYIIDKALGVGKSVLIAVRDTPLTDSDPYTVQERIEMIEAVYQDQDVKVIPIPDIESVNIGRKVGYEVVRYDVPEDIAGISATDIRDCMTHGSQEWKERVPKAVADWFEKGRVLWLTGLSGSGKSTLARALKERHPQIKILDGDEIRTHLCSDLGFSKEDRNENIKRISYVAKCIAEVGGTAVVAAISPYEEARAEAQKLIGAAFRLVWLDTPLEACVDRDVKGLYKKALAGEILEFTGISDPYETPVNPDLILDTSKQDREECVDLLEKLL